jgi:hypothetical protein
MSARFGRSRVASPLAGISFGRGVTRTMNERKLLLALLAAPAAIACSSSGLVAGGADASVVVTFPIDAGVTAEDGGYVSSSTDASIDVAVAGPPFDASITDVTSASLALFVAAIDHGTDYDSLSDDQASTIGAAAQQAADGNATAAAATAAGVGYQVLSLKTSLETYTVLQPTSAAPRGQATLIVRPTWKHDLVIEAPHIPYDFQTDAEATVIFERLTARALLLAGAQRCCSTVPSGCLPNPQCIASGTSVESDPPHSIHSAFHAMHVALATGARTSNAVQLHTNEEPDINGDVLVSNGVLVTSARVAAFASAMQRSDAGTIRTCADPDAGNQTYCGITNAQGNVSNGATDACNDYATTPTDRFLHLEQNANDLHDAGAWGLVVANAIGAAFKN